MCVYLFDHVSRDNYFKCFTHNYICYIFNVVTGMDM